MEEQNVSVVSEPAAEPVADENVSVVDTGAAPPKEAAPVTEEKPGTEPVPADDKKAEEPVAPEKYEFAFPEGFTADQSAIDEITPILQGLKCDNATAQKLADYHFKQMAALIDRQTAELESAKAQWTKELRADSEIGGPRFNDNLAYGSRLLNKYGSDDLKTLLVDTGLDRNPAMVKFLVKVGKVLGEDSWADSGAHGTSVPQSAEDVAKILFNKTL